jgi:hypothetical protein
MDALSLSHRSSRCDDATITLGSQIDRIGAGMLLQSIAHDVKQQSHRTSPVALVYF